MAQTTLTGKNLPIYKEDNYYPAHLEYRYFWQVHGLVAFFVILLLLSSWFLVDVWSENFVFLHILGVPDQHLQDPVVKTVCYTIVGAVMGSIMFQIRSLFKFYITDAQYHPRWIGKYISAPFESAATALVVLCIIRGGLSLFGGGSTDMTQTNNFASFGTGALVGFGMRNVILWLDTLVQNMFILKESNFEPQDKESATEAKGG
jgi:hypothetical protein